MDFEAVITATRQETGDIRTIIFGKPEGFSFVPGQYILMELGVNDPRGSVRPFSIAASPTEDFLMISTRISESPFKLKFRELEEGDFIKVKGPFGRFVMQDASSHSMLTGGIGITPFRSMAKFATDTKLDKKITLIYSNKTPQDIAYKEELEEMQRLNKNLKLALTITRPEGTGWNGLAGRIDENMIKENADMNSVFYACGPPAMVDAMIQILEGMQVPKERVMLEKFAGY